MNIAVLGSGNVGSALAEAWQRAGHNVVYGKRQDADAPASVPAKPIADAIRGAEVIALCVPWSAVADVLSKNDYTGKVLIDCTNPIGSNFQLEKAGATSGGETVARLIPRSKVVKAFNTTGFANMRNPQIRGEKITMFYCGDDATAKQTVSKLITDIGFDPVDAGPLTQARYLEPFAMLWITLSLKIGREFAFQLVRR